VAERARTCTDSAEVAAIKDALERYDGLTGETATTAADLVRLRRLLHYGWHAFQSANYQVVSQLLPDLLVGLQQGYRSLEGQERYRTAELLTQAYWLAAQICFKLARFDLGWIAADRGIQVAEWTGDLTLIGHTTRRIVEAMMAGTDDSARRALALVHTTADRLATNLDRAPTTYLSAYGMLLLKGSIAAARLDNAALSRDLNVEAGYVAARLGDDRNDNWTAFGPTNVTVHRVCALADMREAGRVIDAAAAMTEVQLLGLPRERRANHLVDLARGYSQWGRRDDAVELLIQADHLAREEVRCRPHTHRLITDLVRSYPRGIKPSAPLTVLAKAVRITV
jgi:hypothetical protein